jgi:hypothetical protein
VKHSFGAIAFAILFALATPRGIAQDEEVVLTDIHKRLMIPGYEERHDHDRILFIGEITALGGVKPPYVPCKSAINQSVDYTILETLLGDPPEPTVHTGYVNCTGEPLPSPPYTLHNKVIVYCFHNMSGKFFKCLAPVAFTDERLRKVKSWITESSSVNHKSPS